MEHHAVLSANVQFGLAIFYLLAVLLNVGLAILYFKKKDIPAAGIWAVFGIVFLIHMGAYFAQMGWVLPPAFKNAVDAFMGPVSYFVIATLAFAALLYYRKFFTSPVVALTALNLSLLVFGWALTDKNFRDIIAKPDNVPITMLIYSVAFFTWLGLRHGVINDERLERGDPPMEQTKSDKILVWPDLVYTELICMVICTVVLVVWAILLKAPLEPPASSTKIPNPSKAPWYFLGLQEMLVYYDPWMAGVVLPSFIIVGLIAMPYIDYNQKGNGYYTFKQRSFALITWLYGFLVLWVVLIVLGTFLRGPNWNFFGPFEAWDPHKTVPLNNVNLSEYFWLYLLNRSTSGLHWFIRELPGIILVLVYFIALPPLLARTVMRPFFIKMGFMRFIVLVTLLQFMASLPIKMVLRWTINLKYIVAIPEYFFNI